MRHPGEDHPGRRRGDGGAVAGRRLLVAVVRQLTAPWLLFAAGALALLGAFTLGVWIGSEHGVQSGDRELRAALQIVRGSR